MHYRVNLRLRRRGGEIEREREEHKDNPRIGAGMARTLRAYRGRASVLISVCYLEDDECPEYLRGKAVREGREGEG